MKNMFKNVFVLMTILTFSIVLAACGTKTTKQATTTAGTTATTTAGSGTTTTTGTTKPVKNLNGETIVIMCQILAECDPFDPNYTGQFQQEKKDLQTAAEAKYNVKIEYIVYPSNAGWGPQRVQAIIDGVTSGEPLAHMYQITTNWIGQLAQAEAIAPVGTYIRDYAHPNYDQNQNQFGRYQDDIYGFDSSWVLNDTAGLYYNLDLLEDLNLESPAKLWNEGKWNFSKFKEMVETAQASLNSREPKHYAVGGNWAQWAQNMVTANGGYLINPFSDEVAFNETASLQALTFLNEVYKTGAWEPAPAFDDGSATWKEGKILFHFGELWFVNSDIRWGGGAIGFDLGYVPFPIGDNVDLDDYNTGKYGQVMWAMSGGYEKGTTTGTITDEDVFMVWNEIQYYQSFEDRALDFEIRLEQTFDDPHSIEANLSVLTKVYNERIFGIGVGGFGADEWYTVASQTVMNGDANTRLSAMKPKYDAALDTYLGR